MREARLRVHASSRKDSGPPGCKKGAYVPRNLPIGKSGKPEIQLNTVRFAYSTNICAAHDLFGDFRIDELSSLINFDIPIFSP
jgi:hypothetical protein